MKFGRRAGEMGLPERRTSNSVPMKNPPIVAKKSDQTNRMASNGLVDISIFFFLADKKMQYVGPVA